VAILAHRSLTAYASVLGIHSAGKGYVPLNPKFPIDRLAKMLLQSHCDAMIVGEEGRKTLEALLPHIERPLTILLPDAADISAIASAFPQHRFISSRGLAPGFRSSATPFVHPSSVAYLLFTSGSTGEPKGVPVSQDNVRAYIRYICNQYHVSEYDRFSQMFDMTFDLSVHDMFVCWERGACLCAVPDAYVMAPARFIKEQRITMWFSVPSIVGFMSKMGTLKPGEFPSLRVSLFCGEPLPASSATAWRNAAPQSIIENLYGPTETTIAITRYRWDPSISPSACVNAIVPIGWVFEGQEACIVDQNGEPLPAEEPGELCLSGSQVTRRYWNNPGKTAQQFVRLSAFGDTVWYRTGDLVKQDRSGCLYYLGRMDHQVKIRGYRVELQEIDFVLRQASGCEQVVSLAWPVREGIAEGIVAFIFGSSDRSTDDILAYCRGKLPEYMVPRQILYLDDVPLNVNGKIDRPQLVKRLDNRRA
jgi:amino acid adenylation domain-containing protein